MDFGLSERAQEHLGRLQEFMDSHVYPAEPVYAAQRAELREQGREHHVPQIVEDLKVEARKRGLWNLFLPDSEDPAHGLSVTDYASLAEVGNLSSAAVLHVLGKGFVQPAGSRGLLFAVGPGVSAEFVLLEWPA